jgi:NAD(P)H-dependent flavin oxidoreductase YrpB (nitropropane dioxygenase family)
MSVGGATIALVEAGGGMQVEAYKTRLELVLAVIDNGGIGRPQGPGFGYGSEGHKAALDAVEQQIKLTRASIASEEEDESESSDS